MSTGHSPLNIKPLNFKSFGLTQKKQKVKALPPRLLAPTLKLSTGHFLNAWPSRPLGFVVKRMSELLGAIMVVGVFGVTKFCNEWLK